MSFKDSIVCITIGQSPRPDIMSDLYALTPGIKLNEVGALDDLNASALQKITPIAGEVFYVTKLKNGKEVKGSKKEIQKHIKEKIESLECQKVKAIFLLCTGEFERLSSNLPFFQSSEIIKHIIANYYFDKKIAIITPDFDQKEFMSRRWMKLGIKYSVFSCYPYYETKQSIHLANYLFQSNFDVILLDCIGFPLSMKSHFEDLSQKEVILPREIVAKTIVKFNDNC